MRQKRKSVDQSPVERLESRTLLAVNSAVIDLLVPYTAAALQGAGGQTAIVNKINRAVADLNATLSNSQVAATVRLVGTMQTSFVEDPAGVAADSNALPTIPDIAAMKQKLGADLVDLWVGPADKTQRPPDSEGIANEPTSLTQADPSQAYAVQWWGDSNANLTVHEIGHLLGGGHVQGQDGAPHVIPYAYDYIATVGNATYGTAIDDQAVTGGLIPYYSNPNVFFRGVPLGVADTAANAADNAHVMNQTAPLIAGYSPTVVPDTTAPLAGLGQVQDQSGQNSFTFDVTYYDQGGVDTTSLGSSNIQVTGPNGFNTAATFSGLIIDGNLTPVGATTINEGVVTAQYTVNTTGSPGDLAQYNFSVNAGQVKDVAGNTISAGPLLNASGDNPNNSNPNLLPRNAGDGTGFANDLGNITGSTVKITDFTGPYFYKEGANYADGNLYRFSVATAGTTAISVNGPVTFSLYQDSNGDGQLDPTSEVISAASPGIYNLQPGTNYYLQVSAPYSNGSFAAGGVFTAEITGGGGTANPQSTSGGLSGTVYQDTNANQSKDAGEPGIAGVAVQLTGTDVNGKTVAASATTDSNGNYSFANLAPAGTAGYTLTFTQPANYPLETGTVGSVGGTFATSVTTPAFTGIAVGSAVAFGYNLLESPIPPGASISGTVFNDLNANSTLDTGEPGIAGVTITLTGTSDTGTAVNLTATSDANGNYTFSNVPPVTSSGGYTLTGSPAINFNAENAIPGSGNSLGFAGVSTGNNSLGQVYANGGDVLVNYNFARTAATAAQTAPVANAQTIVTSQNQPVTGNVLTNALAGNNLNPTAATPLTLLAAKTKSSKLTKNQNLMYAYLEGSPQHALHFSLNADGSFNYTPDPNFVGKDTFKYVCVMKASGLCANLPAPITVIVKKADQAPAANTEANTTVYTSQGTPVVIDLQSYVTDSDSKLSSLRYLFAGKQTDGTLRFDGNHYTVLFSPKQTFAGSTTLSFRATDGIKISKPITLKVVVAPINLPISAADLSVTAPAGHAVAVNVLTEIIQTISPSKLTVKVTQPPKAGSATVVAGKIIYHPASKAVTSDTLTYSVTNLSGDTATATITIGFIDK